MSVPMTVAVVLRVMVSCIVRCAVVVMFVFVICVLFTEGWCEFMAMALEQVPERTQSQSRSQRSQQTGAYR